MGMVGREKEQMPENLLVLDEAVKEFAPAVDGRLLPRTTVLGGLLGRGQRAAFGAGAGCGETCGGAWETAGQRGPHRGGGGW